MRYIEFWNKDTSQNDHAKVNKFPERCPYCRFNIEPENMETVNFINKITIEALFKCCKHECGRLFVGVYENRLDSRSISGFDTIFTLLSTVPKLGNEVQFEEEIASLSPSFIKIYNQAREAELTGLDEPCGVGYRKALEFLIKDYLVSKKPEEEEVIKQKALGKCIKDITDNRIKAMAQRAAWLGNDETHYVRKWTSKNTDDLKILIHLCVHWIAMELLTVEFQLDMPE